VQWPAGVEVTVINREVGYCGTADFVGKIDGVDGIGDWKTSRSTQDDHHTQLAALANGEKALIEVPEGTEGAVLFQGQRTVDNVKHDIRAWFIERDLPPIDAAWIGQFRPDEVDPLIDRFIPRYQKLHHLDLVDFPDRFDEFSGYVQAYNAQQRRKRRK
jgi:hypothetical protein